MKKKHIIVWIAVIAVAAAGIYLLNRPGALGHMSRSCSEQTTETSDISFSGEAGERIKFSFQSAVENGNLDIVLYDSAGNEVYTLDSAKELEAFFTLNRSDTYTLSAACMDFIGEYHLSVYKAG